MSTTATYTVNSPTTGQTYYAPQAYWIIPDSGSTVTCVVQARDSHGNLITTSSMTATVNDQSANSNTASYTGYGDNTVTAAGSFRTNGSDVFRAAGSVGQNVGQLTMYLSYTGHAYDQPPNAPGNMTPAQNWIVSSLTPTFSGTFSDPTSGDKLSQYEIVINNGSGGSGTQVWDSGAINASSSEITNNAFSHVYNGPALTFSSTYAWKARMRNQNGNWGAYSGWVTFSTVQGPNAPSSITPSGVQTTLTPAFSFVYTHPAARAMASYRYQLLDVSSQAVLYDSGSIAHSAANNATVSGTIPSGAGLANGRSYTFSVTATDTSSATSQAGTSGFSVSPLPIATPTSPINNVAVGTQTPTFSWTFSDGGGYAQADYQITIWDANAGTQLFQSALIASAATQYTLSGYSIPFGTTIRWQVYVKDTAGFGQSSVNGFALVQNSPTVTNFVPANGSVVTTGTPVVSWTYTPASTGNPQATALLTIYDANGNALGSFNVIGTIYTHTLPVGLLSNGNTYQMQVVVTDTGSLQGSSPVNTFSTNYTPPADMQGQPLGTAVNYLPYPRMDTDINGNGISDGYTSLIFPSSGVSAQFAVDSSISQPVAQEPTGDGPFEGAQKLTLLAINSGLTNSIAETYCDIPVATAGFTPGTTVLSVSAYVMVAAASGSPGAYIRVRCYDGSNAVLATYDGATQQTDTGGQIIKYTGPYNSLIPAGTVTIEVSFRLNAPTSNDLGTAWWMDAQLEAAPVNDPHFIDGGLGTGYSYDSNGYSHRAPLAGNLPQLTANPGADTDPFSAIGGTLTFSWDTTLADSRFVGYLIERRRQDQQEDDTAWVTLTTITDPTVASYVDYMPGNGTMYQYSVRQQIVYSDGSSGISANRAIVTSSVLFSPAWYLVNTSSQIYNFRLVAVSPKRKYTWKEVAKYNNYLGRMGIARDAGIPSGYTFDLDVYYNDGNGDNRSAVRRAWIAAQQLGLIWTLKDGLGLAIPVYIQDIDFNEEDTGGDTLLTVTLHFQQAGPTADY